jgi:hypothetical protein
MQRLFSAGLLGAAVLGYTFYGQPREVPATDYVDQFQLSAPEQRVMHACRASLERHARQFKRTVTARNGCACVARRMSALVRQVRHADDSATIDAIDVLFARSQTKHPGSLNAQFTARPKIAKLAPDDRLKLFMIANGTVGHCSQPANIEKLAQRTIASAD